jgi:hypothetical protein
LAQHNQLLTDVLAQHIQLLTDVLAQHIQVLTDVLAQHIQVLADVSAQHIPSSRVIKFKKTVWSFNIGPAGCAATSVSNKLHVTSQKIQDLTDKLTLNS